jgi:hypothetical protein
MFARFVLGALIVAWGALPAPAADLAEIPRTIRKEPAYAGTPKYCLLVFGKDADTRIWLVLDGNTLYIDRNGNGDLTDAGEKLTNPNGVFALAKIVERDGTVHKHFELTQNIDGHFSIELGDPEKRQQFVGIGQMERPSWGATPETAPIVHFNGPMVLARYGKIYTLPRGANGSHSRRYKLRLMVGTPGLGAGTFASYDELCSEGFGPVQADIEYASAGPGKAPLRQRIELEHDG